MVIYNVLILLLILNCKGDDNHWDYSADGPDVWPENFAACGGEKQSPINIKTKCTIREHFQPFRFSNHNQSIDFNLTNNGHTIVAKTNTPSLSIQGANLSGIFYFDSFHLHWGPNHNSGSEHQVNGEKAAGESHFVYYNDDIKRYAVLSFLMESRNKTNIVNSNIPNTDQWERYFNISGKLLETNKSTTINLALNSLMGNNLNDFWRYEGSLSTPPCTENVIWTVFKERILILDFEFNSFRHDLFYESYRGPQPLYYRKVYRSFQTEVVSPIPDQDCCINTSSAQALSLHYVFILFAFLHIYFQSEKL